MSVPSVSQKEIEQRAYELWIARGCPNEGGNQDWVAAELELRTGAENPRFLADLAQRFWKTVLAERKAA